MYRQASRPSPSTELTKGSSRSPLNSTDPAAGQFVTVKSVRKISEAMLHNASSRQTIDWEAADFSGLLPKQKDAIQRVVSSLLYCESHGGEVCGNLLNRVPYSDISDAFALQILDESHHSWLLTRYLLDSMRRPVLKAPFIAWAAIAQLQRLRDPLICTLAAGYYVECAAAEVQTELINKIDEPLLRQVFRVILRDEARHQALGREAVLFLLETPPYESEWRRGRAKLYRHLLDLYSRLTLRQYSDCASLFGIDIRRIYNRTLEKIDDAVRL
jgi:hypothetical protein